MSETPLPAADPEGGLLTRWAERVAVAFAIAGGGLLTLLGLMQVSSVVLRSTVGKPVPGDFELMQMGIAVVVFFILPLSLLRRSHFSVTLFTDRLPRRARAALTLAGSVAMLAIACLLGWRMVLGGMEMRAIREHTMTLSVPVWWAFVPIVCALAALAFVALAVVVEDWRELRK